MKFTKNRKRFWTLSRSSNGFTLVELIVVIAILAILAGVAVPAYSGYITKANKTNDQQLVSEIANALQLHYYNNGDLSASGYVILTPNSPASANPFGDVAMEAAFGAGWEDNLTLSYDNWSAEMHFDASDANAIANSPYMQSSSVSEKLHDLQGLTSSAVSLLDQKDSDPVNKFNKLGTYLGDDFLQFCVDNGLTTDGDTVANSTQFTNASNNQISNLMVLYVADQMGDMNESQFQTVMINSLSGKKLAETELPDGMDSTTYLAAQYALFNSIAASTGEAGQQRLDAVNAALAGASTMGDVENALAQFYADEDFRNQVNTGYDMDTFKTDVQAITATMGTASSVAKDYYTDASDLDNSEFFTSETISAGVNSYMNAANALGSLSPEDIAELNRAVENAKANGESLVYIVIGNGEVATSLK